MLRRKDGIIIFGNDYLGRIYNFTEFDLDKMKRKEYWRNVGKDGSCSLEWYKKFVPSICKLITTKEDCPEIKCLYPSFKVSGKKVTFRSIWSSLVDEFHPDTIKGIRQYFNIPDNGDREIQYI